MDLNNISRISHNPNLDFTYFARHFRKKINQTFSSSMERVLKLPVQEHLDTIVERIVPKRKGEDVVFEYFIIDKIIKDKGRPTYHNLEVFLYPKWQEVEYIFNKDKILNK